MANLDTLHTHAQALQLPAARLFAPGGKGHPLKEGGQVADDDEQPSATLARQAYDYVVVGH